MGDENPYVEVLRWTAYAIGAALACGVFCFIAGYVIYSGAWM